MKHICFLILLSIPLLFSHRVLAQPGSPDPAFGNVNGHTITNFSPGWHSSSDGVAVQPDGRILVAGGTWEPFDAGLELLAIVRYMPDGSLDPTFGTSGKKTLTINDLSIFATDIAVLPNGRILICGGAWNGDDERLLIVRLNADGTPDNSFDGDGMMTIKVGNLYQDANALVVYPDGKFLVGGYANVNGYEEAIVLRFNANGTPDISFGGGDGRINMALGESYSGVEKLLLQPDGKIIAACHATAGGYEKFAILRLLPNGTPDPTFSGDGYNMFIMSNFDNEPEAVGLQSDGKIVMVGACKITPADRRVAAVRFLPNGMPDNTFGNNGIALIDIDGAYEGANATVVQADGKIVLGGYAYINNEYSSMIIRLLPNGQLDTGFGDQGVSIQSISTLGDWIYDLTIQPDGKIITTGSAWYDELNHLFVARFQNNVSVDTFFPGSVADNIKCFPNPARTQSTLSIELAEAGRLLSVKLYDLQGRFIMNLLSPALLPAGENRLALELPAELPRGQYLLSVETDSACQMLALTLQ